MRIFGRKKFFWQFLLQRSTFFVMGLLLLLCVSAAVAIRKTSAFSQDPAISFEVADYGLRQFVGKFQTSLKTAKIGSLGVCSSGVFHGDYFTAGKYEVSFFSAESSLLGCDDKLSEVTFIRSTSFYHGLSSVVQRWVGGAATRNEQPFSCSGSRPSNTAVYPGDDEGLTEDISWTYSETNTTLKCQYLCDSEYVWNGSACIKNTNSSPPPLKDVIYKGSLKLDVYPAVGVSANAPVLLFLHSGGWYKGDKTDDAARFGASLSALGITVVAPNYTLVPSGYYPTPLLDTDCVRRWIVANASAYSFDANNISLGGYSSGGHIALLYSLRSSAYQDTACPWGASSPSLRNVVALAGPTNLSTITGDVRIMANNFLNGASAVDASPITYASNKNSARYLLLHAQDDELVSFSSQAEPFYNALLASNPSTVQAKWYASGGHLFAFDSNTPTYHDVITVIRTFLEP